VRSEEREKAQAQTQIQVMAWTWQWELVVMRVLMVKWMGQRTMRTMLMKMMLCLWNK